MSKFGKVDVKEVSSDIPRSHFSEESIESLAERILAHGDLLRPLVLEKMGIDSYSVMEGHLEYYSAVKARELDARKAETVNAFIIEPVEVETARLQMAELVAINEHESPSEPERTIEKSGASDGVALSIVSSLEKRFDKFSNDQIHLKNSLEARLSELEKSHKKDKDSDSKISLLEKINRLSEDEISMWLSRYGVSDKKLVTRIYEARQAREGGSFSGFREIVNDTDNFSEKRMLTIIDGWLNYR